MKKEFFKNLRPETTVSRVEDSKFKNSKEVEDDYLEKTIGRFGLWQAVVSVTTILARWRAMWNMKSIVFLIPVTEYRCVEFQYNITMEVKNSTCFDNCLKYEYSRQMGKTIIEEFSLICENEWLGSFTQSILMLGLLVGVTVFGWISDRWGRRFAFLLASFVDTVFMLALPFSPNYMVFNIFRFIIGVSTGGGLIICVVQVLEIVGKKYRELAGACCFLPDAFADMSSAAFGYFTHSWHSYTLSYAVATIIIFVLLLFVPESPRWYVSKGRTEEAIAVATSAAKRNKMDSSNLRTIVTEEVENVKNKSQTDVKTTYIDLFRRKMVVKSLASFSIWVTVGTCYNGIFQYATIISFDAYLTVLVLGAMQLPMCPIGFLLNKTLGRKLSIIGITSFVGIAMIIVIFVPDRHWSNTILSVLSFVCCNTTISILYVYTAELFPTTLRNQALGFVSVGAKVGAMIAPFIAALVPRWLPSLVFGLMAFLAGLSCLLLPETKGQNLKDTIE